MDRLKVWFLSFQIFRPLPIRGEIFPKASVESFTEVRGLVDFERRPDAFTWALTIRASTTPTRVGEGTALLVPLNLA
jgi:hypothetical protein